MAPGCYMGHVSEVRLGKCMGDAGRDEAFLMGHAARRPARMAAAPEKTAMLPIPALGSRLSAPRNVAISSRHSLSSGLAPRPSPG